MNMKRIWFIRHAESVANAGLPTDSPDSIPLTEKGEQQARELAKLITEPPGLFVMTSHIRTQRTAKPILEKFPQVPAEIWPLHEFDFLSPEQCIGTTVEQRRPWVTEYWQRCEPDFVHGTGAESFTAFMTRIITRLKRLEASPHDFIIVFAHGHVMRAIWQYFANGNDISGFEFMRHFRDAMAKLPVPNTAIIKASFDGRCWNIDEPIFVP